VTRRAWSGLLAVACTLLALLTVADLRRVRGPEDA